MGRFFEQIRALWLGWTSAQRITIIGGGILSLIILFALVFYLTKVEYADLYTNISPEEAGRITSKFEDDKQPYKLDGTTIRVPKADRDRLRLKLAGEKLAPTGGIKGWELFDTTKLTMTDYERRINYLRALQGELERTIKTIEGIEDVRVLLVLPQKELFIEKEKPVTCSIKIRLKPYAKIDKEQVQGIINLVSFAVEGLFPNNVTVIDNRGRILSEDMVSEREDTLALKQLALQEDERKKLERRIREKLGRVIGHDKIEVIVKYEMLFDRQETRLEKYTVPGFEQLKISEEKIEEKFKGEGVKPEGVPGIETQIPGYKEVVKTPGPVEYDKKEQRVNYYVDKEETTIVKAPDISKVSVAVLVDGVYELDEKGGIRRDKKGVPIYHPRTIDEMEKFKNLVWAAIGAEEGKEYIEREYIVNVENVQFDRTQEWLEQKREKEGLRRRTMMMAGAGVAGFIFLFIIIAILFSLLRMLTRKEMKPEILIPERKEEVSPLAARFTTEGIALSPEELEALETAERRPSLVAQLIRTWLGEE